MQYGEEYMKTMKVSGAGCIAAGVVIHGDRSCVVGSLFTMSMERSFLKRKSEN